MRTAELLALCMILAAPFTFLVALCVCCALKLQDVIEECQRPLVLFDYDADSDEDGVNYDA